MQPDKLISRIKALLAGDADQFEIQGLAAEYAKLLASTRERFDQCVALIRAGNDYAALQVAEVAPPILDTTVQLDFANSPEWLALCRKSGVPWPAPLDTASVELVNNLYNRQISESHPLYRDYRQAVRDRDDLRSLTILVSIIRINPEDRNARREFVRISEKARSEQLENLANLLAAGDTAGALALAAKLESLHLPALNESPAMLRVLEIREEHERKQAAAEVADAVAQIAHLREQADWRTATPLIGRCRSLAKLGLNLQPETLLLLEDAEHWALERQAAILRAKARTDEIADAVEALRKAIQGSIVNAGTDVMRMHIGNINAAIAKAEAIGANDPQIPASPDAANDPPLQRVPEAKIEEARKRASEITARIKRKKLTTAVIAGIALLVIAAGGAVGFNIWQEKEARELAIARMVTLPTENRLRPAEELERSINDNPKWETNSEFAAAKTKFSAWVAEKRAAVNKHAADADALANRPDDTPPADLQRALIELDSLRSTGGLPADMRDDANAKVAAADKRLSELRGRLLNNEVPALEKTITETEAAFAQIRKQPLVQNRIRALVTLQPALRKIRTDSASLNFLLSTALVQRGKELDNAIATADAEWRIAHTADTRLAPVRSLAAYYKIMRGVVATAEEGAPAGTATEANTGTTGESTGTTGTGTAGESTGSEATGNEPPPPAGDATDEPPPLDSAQNSTASSSSTLAAFDEASEAAANEPPPPAATPAATPAAGSATGTAAPAPAAQNTALARLRTLIATEPLLSNTAEKILAPHIYKLWKIAANTRATDTPFLNKNPSAAESAAAQKLLSHSFIEKIYRNILHTYPDGSAPDRTFYTYEAPVTKYGDLRDDQSATYIEENGTTKNIAPSYRKTGAGSGWLLTQTSYAPEAKFYRDELPQIYDATLKRFNEPILAAIDRLRTARVAPLFKAWLQQELFDIADIRSAENGLDFSPSAQNAMRQLTANVGRLTPRTWLFPDKYAAKRNALAAFYATYGENAVPLKDEARAWLEVFQKLANPGFIYVGYVNSERQIRLVPDIPITDTLISVGADGSLVTIALKDLPAAVRYTDKSLRITSPNHPFATYAPIIALHNKPSAVAATVRFPAGSITAPPNGWDAYILQQPASNQ